MDPAVEPEVEPVDPVLRIPLDEPGQEDFDPVRPAIAVQVLWRRGCRGPSRSARPSRQGITPVGKPRPAQEGRSTSS